MHGFLGLTNFTKTAIGICISCQAYGPEKCPNPLEMSSLLLKPWHILHNDFCGPFHHGEYVLVVIDEYSRFLEVDIIQSTTTMAFISKLDNIFTSHSNPGLTRSDSGLPFVSREINEYMK